MLDFVQQPWRSRTNSPQHSQDDELGLNNLKMILAIADNPTNLAAAQVISTLFGIEQRSLTTKNIDSQLNDIPLNSLLILNDEDQMCGVFEKLRKNDFRGKVLILFHHQIKNSNPILNNEPKGNYRESLYNRILDKIKLLIKAGDLI